MKLLIIRHGEPDYVHDSLTEKGFREAELLKDRVIKENVAAFYCSPLGRAKATAKPTLAALGREATVCDWLEEFAGYVVNPDTGKKRIPWDMLPSRWTADERYYDRKQWLDTPLMRSGNVRQRYEEVCAGLDQLLADHGYRREGAIYRAERSNRDTIVFFCHFGVESVLLSHLLHISPVMLWHGFVALPTSVTTLITEEREQGIAAFRCNGFGDVSHLYAAGEPASFAARFCEIYESDERH